MQTYTKLFLTAALVPLAAALHAADTKPSDTPLSDYLSTPPATVVKVSLTAKESYDSNIYLQSVTTAANQADRSSSVTAITPGITLDYTVNPKAKLSLSYLADINIYHADSNESYNRHTGGLKFSDTIDDLTFSITGNALINDGSKTAPTYTGAGGSPAIGGGERWGRRAYDLYTGNVSVGYMAGNLLIRPVAAGKMQVFHTNKTTITGYQNFENRGETSEGLDLGWKVQPALTAFVSYRAGHQWQDNYFGVTNNYSNDLKRTLVGLEGTLEPWCKVNFLMGADKRTFGAPALLLTGNDKEKRMFWSNSSMVITPSKDDSVTFSYVRFLQPASTGRNAYDDLNAEVQYRHTVDKELTVGVGYRIWEGSYLVGNRRDQLNYSNATMAYKVSAVSSITLDVQHVMTNTAVANGISTTGRTFSRNLYSLTYKITL